MSDAIREEPGEATICRQIGDFYSPASRLLIGRVLASFLDQVVVTPGELLHSAKTLKRLNDAGRVLMNVVDKVGTAQAKTTGEGAAARIRDLHGLIATLTRTVWEDERDTPLPAFTPDTFLAVSAEIGAADNPYLLGRLLAEHLFHQRQWRDKITALVALVRVTRNRPEFDAVELLLAEALNSEPALDQLLGFPERLEDRCGDLIDLWRGCWQPRDTALPVMAEIARMVADGELPHARASLEAALLRAISHKEPLRSAEPEPEIQAVFDMFRRLWNGGQVVGGTRALALLERRQSRHLSTEGVTDLLRERKVVADRIAFLFTLAGMAVGASNRATIRGFVDHYFNDPDFVPRTIAGQEPPIPKMQTLTATWRAIKASWLSDAEKEACAARILAAQAELLKRSRLFEQIEKKGGGIAQKALTLLDLMRKGTFIDGEPLSMAQRLVQAYLRDPSFMGEYLAGAQGEERERKLALLKRTLSAFGLAPAA